jgi:hypothetical protein
VGENLLEVPCLGISVDWVLYGIGLCLFFDASQKVYDQRFIKNVRCRFLGGVRATNNEN